jgi:hypothetical protein
VTKSLTRARRGAVLALVGALLLANPAYLGLVVDEPRSRSPTGYTGTPIDPANASDQRTLLRTVGGDDVLSVDEFAGANEYSPYGDTYRAPRAAADALRRAVESGTATTDDPDAAFTLRRALANHRYVATGERDARQYYRADLDDGDDGLTVTVTPVNRSTVARHVLYSDVVLYSGLPEYQRETVDEVVAADELGYRPYNDEFGELTDQVVRKDGTYYVFETAIHADDFGPSTKGLLALLLAALGALSVLAGAALTGLSYRSGGGSDPGEDDGEPDHV